MAQTPVSKSLLFFYTKVVNAFVQSLDFCRVRFLKLTLRPAVMRSLYAKAHRRLGMGLIACMLFYLPLAILKPEWLLSFGPLIFGYPHLVASYRFTPVFKGYLFILFMTTVAVVLNVLKPGLSVPFGVWQLMVATLTFFVIRRQHLKEVIFAFCLCVILMKLAWLEPIIFVGASLILHNWVAFFYWIKASRTSQRRAVAVLGTFLFLAVHLLVLDGVFDQWIPTLNGAIAFPGSTQNTAWMLASWSTEAVVWYRMMVLYAFGLSVHYFIWLRAIPESQRSAEHPGSFRLITENLKSSLGLKVFLFTVCVCAGGVILWLISMPVGARVYFEIAILHGWLELLFLLRKKSEI